MVVVVVAVESFRDFSMALPFRVRNTSISVAASLSTATK